MLIEYDLTSRIDTFDGIFPALETGLDRIAIVRSSLRDENQETGSCGTADPRPSAAAKGRKGQRPFWPDGTVHLAAGRNGDGGQSRMPARP